VGFHKAKSGDENPKKDFKEKTIVFSLSAHENIYAEERKIKGKPDVFLLRSEGEARPTA